MGFRTNEVYKNNPNAPRLGKGEFSTVLVTKKLWEESGLEISWEDFKNTWIAIADTITEEVCNNPLGVKLPQFLGEWKIQYLPYKMQSIEDPIASSIVGENIPFSNIHSKGKNGKLVWERKGARKFNKALDMWAYEPGKLFSNEVARVLKENPDIFRIAKTRVNNKEKVLTGK